MKKNLPFVQDESLLAKTLEAFPAKDFLKKYLKKKTDLLSGSSLSTPVRSREMGDLRKLSQFFTRLEWLSAASLLVSHMLINFPAPQAPAASPQHKAARLHPGGRGGRTTKEGSPLLDAPPALNLLLGPLFQKCNPAKASISIS